MFYEILAWAFLGGLVLLVLLASIQRKYGPQKLPSTNQLIARQRNEEHLKRAAERKEYERWVNEK